MKFFVLLCLGLLLPQALEGEYHYNKPQIPFQTGGGGTNNYHSAALQGVGGKGKNYEVVLFNSKTVYEGREVITPREYLAPSPGGQTYAANHAQYAAHHAAYAPPTSQASTAYGSPVSAPRSPAAYAQTHGTYAQTHTTYILPQSRTAYAPTAAVSQAQRSYGPPVAAPQTHAAYGPPAVSPQTYANLPAPHTYASHPYYNAPQALTGPQSQPIAHQAQGHATAQSYAAHQAHTAAQHYNAPHPQAGPQTQQAQSAPQTNANQRDPATPGKYYIAPYGSENLAPKDGSPVFVKNAPGLITAPFPLNYNATNVASGMKPPSQPHTYLSNEVGLMPPHTPPSHIPPASQEPVPDYITPPVNGASTRQLIANQQFSLNQNPFTGSYTPTDAYGAPRPSYQEAGTAGNNGEYGAPSQPDYGPPPSQQHIPSAQQPLYDTHYGASQEQNLPPNARRGNYVSQSENGLLDAYNYKQQYGSTRPFIRLITTCSSYGHCDHLKLEAGQADPRHQSLVFDARAFTLPPIKKCPEKPIRVEAPAAALVFPGPDGSFGENGGAGSLSAPTGAAPGSYYGPQTALAPPPGAGAAPGSYYGPPTALTPPPGAGAAPGSYYGPPTALAPPPPVGSNGAYPNARQQSAAAYAGSPHSGAGSPHSGAAPAHPSVAAHSTSSSSSQHPNGALSQHAPSSATSAASSQSSINPHDPQNPSNTYTAPPDDGGNYSRNPESSIRPPGRRLFPYTEDVTPEDPHN